MLIEGSTEQCAPQTGGHRQALKSSAIIGASSIVNLGLGIIRTKILAVLLGPSGVGVMGIYNSIIGFGGAVSSLGVPSSGVREIARAEAAGDAFALSRIVGAMRWISIGLGLFGGATLALLAKPVAQLSFGNGEHTWSVALLGLGIACYAFGGTQGAIIQGLRRMRQVAMINIYSGLAGTILSAPILLIFGQKGIALFTVSVLLTSALVTWAYARQVRLPETSLSFLEVCRESKGCLRLGLAFLTAGVLANGTAYFARLVVFKQTGETGAGMFQAAFALSGIYVGFIVQAMGTDFYPRLAGVAGDNAACSRVTSEQTEVSLLLGLPGVLAAIALAPLVVPLFYAPGFSPAVDILRWQTVGSLFRVASFSMSYVFLAKAASFRFVALEATSDAIQLLLLWLGLRHFGLVGAGVAYATFYLLYWLSLILLARRCYGVAWATSTWRLAAVSCLLVSCSMVVSLFLPRFMGVAVGLLVTLAAVWICGRDLLRHSGITSAHEVWVRLKAQCGSAIIEQD